MDVTAHPPPGSTSVAILGAGPAGLGAAYRLARRSSFGVQIFEKNQMVGGNAGSFEVGGLRVDYGSHRLHPSCAPAILSDIRSMLGDDLLDRPRHGRIRLRGRWVHFPLKPGDLCLNLPPSFIAGVGFDSLRKLNPWKRSWAETFDGILERGLGKTICRDFYFPYARKIWGLDPAELDAIQARRRVSAGSLTKMIRKVAGAIPGLKPKGSGRFFYPRRGFGAISEAYAEAAARKGAKLRLNCGVSAVETQSGTVKAVRIRSGTTEERVEAKHVLSSLPISALVRFLDPPPPPEILEAACQLRFRSMILIYLVLGTDRFTEFDAHYFPDANIPLTRLSEPKNYGLATLPGHTVLCAELPCTLGDATWNANDQQLAALVLKALDTAGIPCRAKVVLAETRRLPQAYPIYTLGYDRNFEKLDTWLNGLEGLVTFGRQGLFAHDNTHHALAMAYALDDCFSDEGCFDRQRWAQYRVEFEKHVVED